MLGGVVASGVAPTGVAGCLRRSSGGSLDSIAAAYLSIDPHMQYFVMQGEGRYDAFSVDVTIERSIHGPSAE